LQNAYSIPLFLFSDLSTKPKVGQTYHRFLRRMISSPERMLSQVLKAVLGRIYVNWSIHPWTVQILEYDITTFNIAFPIPYT
jgi:hypothetical protein